MTIQKMLQNGSHVAPKYHCRKVVTLGHGCRTSENHDSGYGTSNIEETALQGSPSEIDSKSAKNVDKECSKVG